MKSPSKRLIYEKDRNNIVRLISEEDEKADDDNMNWQVADRTHAFILLEHDQASLEISCRPRFQNLI